MPDLYRLQQSCVFLALKEGFWLGWVCILVKVASCIGTVSNFLSQGYSIQAKLKMPLLQFFLETSFPDEIADFMFSTTWSQVTFWFCPCVFSTSSKCRDLCTNSSNLRILRKDAIILVEENQEEYWKKTVWKRNMLHLKKWWFALQRRLYYSCLAN